MFGKEKRLCATQYTTNNKINYNETCARSNTHTDIHNNKIKKKKKDNHPHCKYIYYENEKVTEMYKYINKKLSHEEGRKGEKESEETKKKKEGKK